MLRHERDRRRNQVLHESIVAEPARQENRPLRLSERTTSSVLIASTRPLNPPGVAAVGASRDVDRPARRSRAGLQARRYASACPASSSRSFRATRQADLQPRRGQPSPSPNFELIAEEHLERRGAVTLARAAVQAVNVTGGEPNRIDWQESRDQ
jgi:hypothetical protein